MRQSKISPANWLWASGAALIVFAARSREIQLYAGDTPYLDQWWVEAKQILLPWLQGKLSWTAFFAPHHEHIPAWSRLLAWLQAACLGRWDPLLQCTFNAIIFSAVVGLWAGWFRRMLPLLPAVFLSVLAIALASLPHGWENSTWGFQSHIPLALLFVTWHIHGAFAHPPFTRKWWAAQAAGVASFFTLGTMWAAPAAVCLTALWARLPDRRRWKAAAILACVGLGLMVAARAVQPHSGAFSLSADSPQQFLADFLLQLGWPAQWPGAAALLCLPGFLLALDLRRNSRAEPIDLVALALVVWTVAQAAAFAYGRGSYLGFVSRYGDLLALGVIAHGLALWRLLHRHRSWWPLLTIFAVGWIAAMTHGLKYVSTRAHTEYFHGHAAGWTKERHDAVHQYLVSHDAGPLSSESVRGVLYPDPAVVTEVLEQPGLASLFPASLRPAGIEGRGDFISEMATQVRGWWFTLIESGILLLLIGIVLTGRAPLVHAPPSADSPTGSSNLRLLAILCAVSGAMIFLWPMPFEFRPEKRLNLMMKPPGTVAGLSFKITTPSEYPGDRIIGAAALSPVDFRNTFFGTHVDGPTFTGRAESSPFPLTSPWLVTPFAGFPASPGNSLLLQIEDLTGKILTELSYPGPNPADVDFWEVDVRSYVGQQARVVLIDGRNDAEGWLAISPPQPTQNSDRARHLQHSWKLERTEIGHRSLGVIFGVFLLLAAGLFVRRKKSEP